jgi:hypothetical protein
MSLFPKWGEFIWGASYWGSYGLIIPLYDRNQSDIDYLKSLYESIKSTGIIPEDYLGGLKGALNYSDLNRIENNCEYLSSLLNLYGYYNSITVKTNWIVSDLITLEELNRIRHNVNTLLDCYINFSDKQEIIYNNNLNFTQINTLEWNLYIINLYSEYMILGFRNSGEFYSGE